MLECVCNVYAVRIYSIYVCLSSIFCNSLINDYPLYSSPISLISLSHLYHIFFVEYCCLGFVTSILFFYFWVLVCLLLLTTIGVSNIIYYTRAILFFFFFRLYHRFLICHLIPTLIVNCSKSRGRSLVISFFLACKHYKKNCFRG